MNNTASLRRVESHMGTVITLAGQGITTELADEFFERIRQLESLLTRFRPESEISRIANGTLSLDNADPAVREVIQGCTQLREQTDGDFEFEPRARTGNDALPVLDTNGLAKGWIIEQAALVLRLGGVDEFFVNAGGDIVVSRRPDHQPWRVGIRHPDDETAVLGAMALTAGAIATSGTYERGAHIVAAADASLTSVTVVGPDLGLCDALATAVFAAGVHAPSWWSTFGDDHGLLTVNADGLLRWTVARRNGDATWLDE